jgi:hypothetical protein
MVSLPKQLPNIATALRVGSLVDLREGLFTQARLAACLKQKG